LYGLVGIQSERQRLLVHFVTQVREDKCVLSGPRRLELDHALLLSRTLKHNILVRIENQHIDKHFFASHEVSTFNISWFIVVDHFEELGLSLGFDEE